MCILTECFLCYKKHTAVIIQQNVFSHLMMLGIKSDNDAAICGINFEQNSFEHGIILCWNNNYVPITAQKRGLQCKTKTMIFPIRK